MKKILSVVVLSCITMAVYAQNKKLDQIIGKDTRVRITNANAKSVHNSIGLLVLTFSKSSGTCTGTVVGVRHVITSAHCVYNFETKEKVKSIHFLPGLRSAVEKKSFPYGSFAASRYQFNPGYLTKGTAEEDYAIITFSENLPVPALEMAVLNSKNANITIAGYAGDKAIGELWEGTGVRYQSKNSNTANNHNVDTFAGQSGSVVRFGNKVVGVHSAAVDYESEKSNLAFFFTGETLKKIKSWMNPR